MSDLISRSAAIEQVERREKILGGSSLISTRSFKNFLMNRPAVDAEPVIRCNICKHYETDTGYCYMHDHGMDWDDFCSRGEKVGM